MKKNRLWLLVFIFFFACHQDDVEVLGYAPIYGDTTIMAAITLQTPKPYETAGKIYVLGNILYQVETGKGIHITNISNPTQPQKTGFIEINGAQEIAAKDGYLFANNYNDLVILQVTANSVSVVKRLKNAFRLFTFPQRPPENGKFECPDPKKGIIIGWTKKKLINPNCSY